MKKYLFSLMTIVMVAMASVCFVSCGDDDDNGNGSNNSTSSGVQVSAGYGYFHKNSSTSWEFYFCSLDMGSPSIMGKTIDMIIIDLKTENGSEDIPVGEFTGCFAVDIQKGMKVSQSGESEEGTYYESGGRSTTTGKLTIKKNGGNNYTVSYAGVNLYNDDSKTPAIKDASFSFTGALVDYPWYDE